MHKSKNVTVRETKSKTKIKIMENGDQEFDINCQVWMCLARSCILFRS